jgi:dihydroorotate dehydrogenase electron transfer subunit
MKKIVPQRCRVIENRRLDKAGSYYQLKLDGFVSPRAVRPGQFVHLKVASGLDPFFRRAFSISDFDSAAGVLEIIYKVVGRGTSRLREVGAKTNLDLIGPLGNRFTVPAKSKAAVLVAGGVGLPPLAFLARHLVDRGHDPKAIFFFYGGRTKADLIDLPRLRRRGINLFISTDDGSQGFKGMITDALMHHRLRFAADGFQVYGCGPEPMLAALQNLALTQGWPGEISLEAPMPCGVGVCLGCIKPSLSRPGDYVRVCHDGPVFKMGEVRL